MKHDFVKSLQDRAVNSLPIDKTYDLLFISDKQIFVGTFIPKDQIITEEGFEYPESVDGLIIVKYETDEDHLEVKPWAKDTSIYIWKNYYENVRYYKIIDNDYRENLFKNAS